MKAAGLAVLLLASSAAAERKDPFADKIAFWTGRGFTVKERISRSDGPRTALVALYGGPESDRLEAYIGQDGDAKAVYTHPGSDRLELDGSPAGRFADLFGDGSRVVAYRARRPGLGSALYLLRWQGDKVRLLGKLAEGRVERGAGAAVFSSRSEPLGKYFSVGCAEAGATARGAFKTTLYGPRGKRLEVVDADHPEFFEAEIEKKEAALSALPGGMDKSTGEYAGLALSIYFDEVALGNKSAAWDKLRGRLNPKGLPRSLKKCMSSFERELAAKLNVGVSP